MCVRVCERVRVSKSASAMILCVLLLPICCRMASLSVRYSFPFIRSSQASILSIHPTSSFHLFFPSILYVSIEMDSLIEGWSITRAHTRQCTQQARGSKEPLQQSHLTLRGGMADVCKPDLLPANVVPRHYDLSITPDLKEFVFSGTVRIDVDVVTSTDSIELHGLDVIINSAQVTLPGVTHTHSGFCRRGSGVVQMTARRSKVVSSSPDFADGVHFVYVSCVHVRVCV